MEDIQHHYTASVRNANEGQKDLVNNGWLSPDGKRFSVIQSGAPELIPTLVAQKR